MKPDIPLECLHFKVNATRFCPKANLSPGNGFGGFSGLDLEDSDNLKEQTGRRCIINFPAVVLPSQPRAVSVGR